MWTGPLGAPKDFEIGTVALEVKARRTGARPMVAISSEFQLDPSGFAEMYLYVINLTRPTPSEPGLSLTDAVTEARSNVQRMDPGALEALEVHLMAVGYRDVDDYSDSLWMKTGSQLYRVSDGFPRIASTSLTGGVERVRYDVALNDCKDFEVSDTELISAITERLDASHS